MTKIHQVRVEFGETFKDVVKGFAEMGYSRRATAEILEFNLSYFRQLCTRFDLHRYFKPQKDMRPECRAHGKGWLTGKKRPFKPRKYSDEFLLEGVRKHPKYYEFMAAVCHPGTVNYRFGKTWREIVRQQT